MVRIAFKMLTGDRNKYLVLVLGVAFATLLMAHQTSVFWGVMRRTTSQIRDIHPDGLWVMDPKVRYIDEFKSLSDGDLYRVRGVAGVSWAVPLFKGFGRAQVSDGDYRQVVLVGLDDDTLAGAPARMAAGKASDLYRPDAVIIDELGYKLFWPDEPVVLGKVLEINDRRAVLVGVSKVSNLFQTLPILYTRFQQAEQYAPARRSVSYVLAQTEPGVSPRTVCERIEAKTGLRAMTGAEFSAATIVYYFRFTGIPLNFMVVVGIGFVVGIAIAGQTFYLFTVDNLRQFGVLKALGVSNLALVGMILVQTLVVGAIGYSVGIGLAVLLIETLTHNVAHLAGFFVPWQVMAGTAVAVLFIMVLASLLSIRRVLVLEAALVYQGSASTTSKSPPARRTPLALPVPPPAAPLTCQQIVKEFGADETCVKVLRGVDLELPCGEMTLLVGPSGCGKTTLISTIAGLLEPTSGDVWALGTHLTGLSSAAKVRFRRENIGFVFQQYNLLPALTAAENAAVPLIIAGVPRREALQRARICLEKLGLGHRAETLPSRLSSGQQQRVAIARALVHEPRLLVCDEPTAALDAQAGQVVMELLHRVAVQPGRVVLVVTHDSRVYGFGDRVVHMEDGRIVLVETTRAREGRRA